METAAGRDVHRARAVGDRVGERATGPPDVPRKTFLRCRRDVMLRPQGHELGGRYELQES